MINISILILEKKSDSSKKLSDLSPNSNSSQSSSNIESATMQQQQQLATQSSRKTTTWNVKRNQQNTPTQSDSPTPPLPSDDTPCDVGHIEPGSPMFAKELLSIRSLFYPLF